MPYPIQYITAIFSILVASQFSSQVVALTSDTVSDHPYNYEILSSRINKLSDRMEKYLKKMILKVVLIH